MQNDADGRIVLDSIRRIVRALRDSSVAAERTTGITGAQLFVLQNLSSAGVMSVNDLAARTFTHQSTVSVVVARLVARGLVRKSAARSDRRRVDLSVSARGRALLARAPGAVQERLVAAVRALPAAERKRLASTMSRLAQSVDASPRRPSMFFEGKPAS